MKGIHQLTLTNANGDVWLNVPVHAVVLGDGCIQADFCEVRTNAAPGKRKTRKFLTKAETLKVLQEIRKVAPAGAQRGQYDVAKLQAIANRAGISYPCLLTIHQLKHTHLRNK